MWRCGGEGRVSGEHEISMREGEEIIAMLPWSRRSNPHRVCVFHDHPTTWVLVRWNGRARSMLGTTLAVPMWRGHAVSEKKFASARRGNMLRSLAEVFAAVRR